MLPEAIQRVLSGRANAATVAPDGAASDGAPSGHAVLPGAFNPLHEGHTRLLEAACELSGRPGAFEISVVNVEKPELTPEEIAHRLPQFRRSHTVVVSRAATFVEKARLMPSTQFVIGYDTAVRLFDESFYPPYDPADDPDHMGSASLLALNEIRSLGCGFMVAGRALGREFKTLRDIEMPVGMENMFTEVPPERFRMDISSTEIREQKPRGR